MKYDVLEVNSEMERVQSNRASVDEVKVHIREKWPINLFIHWPKTILPSIYCYKQSGVVDSYIRPNNSFEEHQKGEMICYDWFTDDLNTCVLLTRGEKSFLTHDVDRKKQGETRSWCGKQVTVVQVTLEVTNQLLKCIMLPWLRAGWQFKPFECKTLSKKT